ncbi:MAG: hypothetical protein IT170_14090, partial [Bryobacterales bacterium]|nr:hypothetical protein [Bryobacterales bacterium]
MRSRQFFLALGAMCLIALCVFAAKRDRLRAAGHPFLHRQETPPARRFPQTPASETGASRSSTAPAIVDGRLSNFTSASSLLERDSVILLENALIDTSVPRALNIPEAFRAHGDPGAYIVQARPGALADAVRRATQLGAQPVSFIPNNAWLVRASAALERSLAEVPEIAA